MCYQALIQTIDDVTKFKVYLRVEDGNEKNKYLEKEIAFQMKYKAFFIIILGLSFGEKIKKIADTIFFGSYSSIAITINTSIY